MRVTGTGEGTIAAPLEAVAKAHPAIARTEIEEGYDDMSAQMVALAQKQPGFLGMESARSGLGITVSYWKDLDSIRRWKQQTDHLAAQRKGRSAWYSRYTVRIAKVEREYNFTLE